MAKNYTQPQLTAYGNIEELTQLTAPTGPSDSLFSSQGNAIATGPGGTSITSPGPVTINPGTPVGVPIS